jgi:hypothetical protein
MAALHVSQFFQFKEGVGLDSNHALACWRFRYHGQHSNTPLPFRMVRCGGTNDKPYADFMHH